MFLLVLLLVLCGNVQAAESSSAVQDLNRLFDSYLPDSVIECDFTGLLLAAEGISVVYKTSVVGEQVTHSKRYCGMCQQKFASEWSFKRHLETDIHGAEPKYPCTFTGCCKMFKTNDSRRRHVQSHTLLQSWKCFLCGKLYKYKKTLERHQKKKHTAAN